jgi:hypothetical protein
MGPQKRQDKGDRFRFKGINSCTHRCNKWGWRTHWLCNTSQSNQHWSLRRIRSSTIWEAC